MRNVKHLENQLSWGGSPRGKASIPQASMGTWVSQWPRKGDAILSV